MRICYSIKQLGKKHPIIHQAYLEIDELSKPTTLRRFLIAIVQQQVQRYNKDHQKTPVLSALNITQISSAQKQGKITFGDIPNATIVDEEVAVKNALQAFEDGLFAVFLGDDQLEALDDAVDFDETTVFSFIRLTFLVGSYW